MIMGVGARFKIHGLQACSLQPGILDNIICVSRNIADAYKGSV